MSEKITTQTAATGEINDDQLNAVSGGAVPTLMDGTTGTSDRKMLKEEMAGTMNQSLLVNRPAIDESAAARAALLIR